MKVFHGPRQGGKTTKAMEWLKKDKHRILLTFNHAEESRLKHLYPKLKNRIRNWNAFREGFVEGYDTREIAIDNVDLILQSMVNKPIRLITITREE